MDAPEGWVPAFHGQRPPFQAGNTLAVKSGMYSPAIVDPVAAEIIERTLEDPAVDYLRQPRYQFAVKAWGGAEARLALLERHVDDMTMDERLDSGGGRVSPEEQLRKADVTAMNHRKRLGLDPMSAARLGKDVAATRAMDTAMIMAELHEMDRKAK